MGRGISWKRELTQVLGEEDTGGNQCDAVEAEASLQFDESMFRYSGSSGSSSAGGGGLLGNFLEDSSDMNDLDSFDFGDSPENQSGEAWNYDNSSLLPEVTEVSEETETAESPTSNETEMLSKGDGLGRVLERTPEEEDTFSPTRDQCFVETEKTKELRSSDEEMRLRVAALAV